MIEQNRDLLELPKGWAWVKLGEIADYINGRAFKPSEWEKHGRPILRIQNLTGSTNTINRYSKPIEDKYIVRNGDFLISWSATLGTFVYKGEEAALNQHIFKVQPFVDKTFLFYLTTAYIAELRKKIHGTGMQHITKGKFEASIVPLSPLPEQHRIIAKIEELFTRLDAGVEELNKIKAQLKRYRQAVLKAAFEGRLTAGWREAHKDELEPASVLLERIKEERKKNAKGKYKDQPPVETSDLPELPRSWVWTNIGTLFDVAIGGTPSRQKLEYWNGNIPWVSSSEVANCHIKSTREHITALGLQNSNAKLRPAGTVLLAMIGEGKTRGQVARLDISASTNQNVASILFHNSGISPDYVFHWLIGRYEKTRNIGSGDMQKALNSERVKLLIIPLCSTNEQNIITEEIERYFTIVDKIENTMEQSLKQADRLRQSILKRAFEGKLVLQDPNDEPAEKLLERIKAEKAKRKVENKQRRLRKNDR